MITPKTVLNAIIGYPLDVTLSPAIHTALYEAYGIDAVMLAFPTSNVAGTLSALRALRAGLIAVTIPHKEAIIELLDDIDPLAKEVGAVNTIIHREGKLYGYNTDVDGIRFALGSVPFAGKRVLVVGAGGAARVAAVLVAKEGGELAITNRTELRGRQLADQVGATFIPLEDVHVFTFDMILNMTPAGIAGDTPLPGVSFTKNMLVMDCVYTPAKTRLLLDAEMAGAHTVGGIEMFIGQAAKQIELWSQRDINPNHIREIILQRTHNTETP